MIAKEHIIAKAQGFTVAFREMATAQHSRNPDPSYGEDYNKLHTLVIESYPDLEPLMPPLVTVSKGEWGDFTNSTYANINAYCHQIVQILSTEVNK